MLDRLVEQLVVGAVTNRLAGGHLFITCTFTSARRGRRRSRSSFRFRRSTAGGRAGVVNDSDGTGSGCWHHICDASSCPDCLGGFGCFPVGGRRLQAHLECELKLRQLLHKQGHLDEGLLDLRLLLGN
jgi:hypothetical protein